MTNSPRIREKGDEKNMISVIAKIFLNPGQAAVLENDVKALAEKVAGEEGTLFYTVNADKKAPDTLVFMERYRDMAALKKHSGTAYFQEFMGKVLPVMAKPPEIAVLEELLSAKS